MTPEVEYRQVGRTQLSVPTFGYGAAHLGELYHRLPDDDAVATVEAAWAGGIRLYDTAPWYGNGLSEHRLGYVLRRKPRAEYVLSTKVGRVYGRPADPANFDPAPWTGGLPFRHRFDYTYDGVMRAYEQSMLRLGINTIDCLIIHDLDKIYHDEEFVPRQRDLAESGIRALEELKRTGDIKAIGMGINTDEALATVAEIVDLDFVLVAMPYTLLDQGPLHTGMARCIERGVSVVIGSPFASGILVSGSGGDAKYGYATASEDVRAKVRGIEAVCAAHGVRLPSAALQFVLAHPAVVAAVPGAVSPREVNENIASFNAPIPEGFWSDLKAEGLIDAAAPTPRSR